METKILHFVWILDTEVYQAQAVYYIHRLGMMHYSNVKEIKCISTYGTDIFYVQ